MMRSAARLLVVMVWVATFVAGDTAHPQYPAGDVDLVAVPQPGAAVAAVAECPAGCNGRGKCVRGVCVCDASFSGTNCSLHQAAGGGDHLTPTSPIVNILSTYPSLHAAISTNAKRTRQRHQQQQQQHALRMCFVTGELVGPVSNGGIGTAFTTLAIALAHAGHNVSVVFTRGAYSEKETFAYWQTYYQAAHGISLTALPVRTRRHVARHIHESYEAFRAIDAAKPAFDVVHFHDYEGAGYYSVLARSQGRHLTNSLLVVGAHGPSLWAKVDGNGEGVTEIRDLEIDFMERRAAEGADFLIAPSNYILKWMDTNGWKFRPNRAFVQPNLLPLADRAAARDNINHVVQVAEGMVPIAAMSVSNNQHGVDDGVRMRRTVRELVFFARLETRKGIVLFCDAVDRLLAKAQLDDPNGVDLNLHQSPLPSKVTFMGRPAMVSGAYGDAYVRRRAREWNVPWQVVTNLGAAEAKAYLREGERLAVMPSLVENSPYTVYECAELGVPFLASNVGGAPDLVHTSDHPHALFTPTVEALTGKLREALLEGVVPARPSIDAAANEQTWLDWHAWAVDQRHDEQEEAKEGEQDTTQPKRPYVTAVLVHFNRPALCKLAIESLAAQDYPADSWELLLIDDGSTNEDAKEFLDSIELDFSARGWRILREPNRYLGAARNTAARHAEGEFILFMDDDNYAKPHEISAFVTAMTSSGADVLTSFVNFFWSTGRPTDNNDRPTYMFLGGSADVGAFKNCYGDANSFMRKSSFFKIGGYTEDYGVGFEDWEFYANASLQGYKVDIVPEALYHYRFTPGSMQKTTNFQLNRRRSLRPYLKMLPDAIHDVILGAVFPRKADGTIGAPVGLAAQGASKFHGAASADGELVGKAQASSLPKR